MARDEFRNYHRLKAKLKREIGSARTSTQLQEMPDEIWRDESRRLEWIQGDRPQWDYNNSRLARLTKLYDKCFPSQGWVIGEIEAFFSSEEGPLY